MGLKFLNVGALILHGKYREHQNVNCLAQGESIQDGKFITLVLKNIDSKNSVSNFADLEGNFNISINDSTSFFVYQTNSVDFKNDLIFDNDQTLRTEI